MDFEVQLNQLKKCVLMQDTLVQKLVNEKNHLNWVCKSIQLNSKDINTSIHRIELQLHQQIGCAEQLKAILELIQRTYEITENGII